MAKRNISFLHRWKSLMISGDKTMTCRTSCMANPGDTFAAFGYIFLVKSVIVVPLKVVATEYYEQEGCKSPNEFVKIWETIHPKGFKGDEIVFLHKFELQESPIQGALLKPEAVPALM